MEAEMIEWLARHPTMSVNISYNSWSIENDGPSYIVEMHHRPSDTVVKTSMPMPQFVGLIKRKQLYDMLDYMVEELNCAMATKILRDLG